MVHEVMIWRVGHCIRFEGSILSALRCMVFGLDGRRCYYRWIDRVQDSRDFWDLDRLAE